MACWLPASGKLVLDKLLPADPAERALATPAQQKAPLTAAIRANASGLSFADSEMYLK